MFIKARCILNVSDVYRKSTGNIGLSILDDLRKKKLVASFFPESGIKEKGEYPKELVQFLDLLPPSAMFSISLSTKKRRLNSFFISLPIFSSHLKIPVKENEHIWIQEYKDELNYPANSINLINSYWVSRVHSLFHTEDVNYSYSDRDYAITAVNNFYATKNEKTPASRKKDRNKRNDEISDSIKEQFTGVLTDFGTNDALYSKLQSQNKRKLSLRSVPRYFSSEDELHLQGSDNTLVLLGRAKKNNGIKENKRHGQISLVSGRGERYIKELKDKPVDGEHKVIDRTGRLTGKTLKIKNNNYKTLPVTITNNDNHEESFKFPRISCGPDNANDYNINHAEGNLDLNGDASTVIISEAINVDNILLSKEYELNNITSLSNSDVSIQDYLSLSKASLSSKAIKSFTQTSRDKAAYGDVPTIAMSSTNFRLYACNDSKYKDINTDGSIYLIKDSKTIDNYAEVGLQDDGNIILNGKSILIGDYKRAKESSNGEGTGVILGVNGDLNSGVLGEKLVAVLCELIEINKESLSLISKALIETSTNFNNINSNLNTINLWLNTHVHVSPSTVALPPIAPPAFSTVIDIDSSSSSNGIDEIERLTDLVKNIDKILSKFVKTSWLNNYNYII